MAYSVVLKRGDMLCEEWAEFVVNPSNTSLILGSGVSAALQNLCGRELQKEMDSAKEQVGGEIKQGDVLPTLSTCDKFLYILHAAVMDYTQKRRAFGEANPTLQTIETILFNIESILLAHCQSRKNTKLLLPFMGCGVGGLHIKDVAVVYKEFFARSVEFGCEVVIYAYGMDDYEGASLVFGGFDDDKM